MPVPPPDVYLGIGIALNLACFSTDLPFGGTLALAPVKDLALIFYSLAAGLSILLTGAISFKLLLHKRRIARQSSGLRSSDADYVGVVGILVESAVVYSGSCLIFVIMDALNSPSLVWIGAIQSAGTVRISLSHHTMKLTQ
jgi:hypothetical protein